MAVADLTLGIALIAGVGFAVLAAPWLVLVFRIVLLVLLPQPLGLLDEGPLVIFIQEPGKVREADENRVRMEWSIFACVTNSQMIQLLHIIWVACLRLEIGSGPPHVNLRALLTP